MRLLKLVAIVFACALTTGASQFARAAVVTWATPIDITNSATADLDVSTNGMLFSAVNIGGALTTVNGVTFADGSGSGTQTWDGGKMTLTHTGSTFLYDGLAASTGSTSYDTLLDIQHSGLPGVGATLTFSTLTAGKDYEIQLWTNDSRPFGSLAGRTTTAQDASGGSVVTLLQNQSGTAPNTGQYVLGTFTADATSQVLNVDGSEGFNFSAAQIREITAVPEPSSFAWIALGLGAIGLRARRRRQQATT